MNIRACAEHLLTYFSPEERGIPDNVTYPGRNAAVRKAMNEALQDLFGRGRPWARKDDRGVVVHPPAVVQVACVKGSSEAIISVDAWQSWFQGCSIVIEGANVDNEVRSAQQVEKTNGPIIITGDLSPDITGLIPVESVVDGYYSYRLVEESGRSVWVWRVPNEPPSAGSGRWRIEYEHSVTGDDGQWIKVADTPTPVGLTGWTTNGTGDPEVAFGLQEWKVKLKFPYSGDTGVHSATIWHDSIEIETDVLEVHEPVRVNNCDLSPVNNPKPGFRARREDYGFHPEIGCVPCTSDRVGATAGRPFFFNVDTWLPTTTSAPEIRMRLSPAPATEMFLEYSVMLCPPRITDLSSTDELPIPFGFIESIFLPFAEKKLKSCPFWREVALDSSVDQNYASALALLEEGDPKRRSVITLQSKL